VLIAAIKLKYQQYGITQKPFVIIKADAGTYGMSVMTVHSGDDVRGLNRKQRTKMAKSKGGALVSRAIVQEGVYTAESWGEQHAAAEPVVYLMDQEVIGAFYRVHPSQGSDQNLNAPGMEFHAYDAAEINQPENTDFYIHSIIARLAALAAAREMRA